MPFSFDLVLMISEELEQIHIFRNISLSISLWLFFGILYHRYERARSRFIINLQMLSWHQSFFLTAWNADPEMRKNQLEGAN